MAAKASENSETLLVAGRELTLSNPDKVFFPAAGITKRDLVHYYLSGRGGRAARLGWSPQRAGALPQRRRERVLLPEACAELATDLARGRDLALSLRPHRRRAGATRRRGAGVDGEPGLPRAASASGARRGPRASRRAARRPRSRARRRLEHAARGGARHARSAGGGRAVRLAQDLGLARYPCAGAHHAALLVQPGAARGAGAGTRGRATRARASPPASGGRKSATACSSTTTRTPRIARSPRAYSVRPTPDARVSAPVTWEELDVCQLADFTLRSMPARFAERGDRHKDIDGQAFALEALLELSARQEAEGSGRCTLATALSEAAGRADARRTVAQEGGGREAQERHGSPRQHAAAD